jgi:hypothetical protein
MVLQSSDVAAQSGGDNEKKWKAAPGSLLLKKAYRLDSGQ